MLDYKVIKVSNYLLYDEKSMRIELPKNLEFKEGDMVVIDNTLCMVTSVDSIIENNDNLESFLTTHYNAKKWKL